MPPYRRPVAFGVCHCKIKLKRYLPPFPLGTVILPVFVTMLWNESVSNNSVPKVTIVVVLLLML